MRGNWSLTKVLNDNLEFEDHDAIIQYLQEQLEPDKIPDFCSGFLYVTKPQVGAALAQVQQF